MSKRKDIDIVTPVFFSVLAMIIGIGLEVLYFVLPIFKTEEGKLWSLVCLGAGIVLFLVGFIVLIVCVAKRRRNKQQMVEEGDQFVDYGFDSQPVDAPSVTYIPSREAYEYIDMGKYQTIDEKFAQIGQMDKTQFVIYVARLFSRKGYQVKLTPVMDNHGIDLLVEKMGVTIAVGCLLTNRVLCKEDIVCVRDGRAFYGVNNCMALTNMYFDKTALDYSKAEHMSLVDRNVLVSDFMN